jgi:hypothetical protein
VQAAATFATAVTVAACLDLSGPTDGIESISTVQAAYPAAVAGDTLRDSMGTAVPFAVIVYDGHGDSVAVPEGLRYFLPDTGTDARVENGFFIAGTRYGPVRVVAQVAGIQTPPRTIEVVPAPTVVRANPETLGNPAVVAPVQYTPATITINSAPLGVVVQGDTAGLPANVNGWVVSYRITRQPPGIDPAAPPAYLATEQGRAIAGDSAAAADTTAAGAAARIVVLRPILLEQEADTVEVEATVRYRGAHVPGSPILFRVPVEPKP